MSMQFTASLNNVQSVSPAVLARPSWPMAAKEDRTGWDRAPRTTDSTLRVAQDREIYGESDKANAFFKVVSGVVRTCKFLSDGRRQIAAFYVEGDVFGFEPGAEYQLTAEAVCDCELISFRRHGLEKIAADNDALSRHLFSYALGGMTRAQDHALMLGRRSAVEKVAAFLMEWARHAPGAQTVALAMTRQDIADYLGLTIETVSRTLTQLERDDVIEIPTARRIRFKDRAALRELSA